MTREDHQTAVLAELRKQPTSRDRHEDHGQRLSRQLGLVEMTRSGTRESSRTCCASRARSMHKARPGQDRPQRLHDILREICARRAAVQPKEFRVIASATVVECCSHAESAAQHVRERLAPWLARHLDQARAA